nr:serine hydrolase domain-containing protein [Corallococcus exiguus]
MQAPSASLHPGSRPSHTPCIDCRAGDSLSSPLPDAGIPHASNPIAVVSALLVGLLLGAPAAAHDSLRERIEAFVRAEQRRQGVPGLAVGVVRHGRVVLSKGYGFANLEHQVPVETETLFQSGSVGKVFTAMTVMLQVEAGRVELSDSITWTASRPS